MKAIIKADRNTPHGSQAGTGPNIWHHSVIWEIYESWSEWCNSVIGSLSVRFDRKFYTFLSAFWMEYILVKCDKRNMGEDVNRYCFYQISDLFYYYICQKVVKLIIVCIGLPYYWLCWWRELRSAETCYLYICSLSGQLSLLTEEGFVRVYCTPSHIRPQMVTDFALSKSHIRQLWRHSQFGVNMKHFFRQNITK